MSAISIEPLEMSLEQYKELAVQEQRYPKNPISKLVSILQSICTFWTPTPLEKLLIDDDDTFKKLLTLKYSTIEHIEGVGEVHSLIIPHPLKSLLNNSSMSTKCVEEIEYEIANTPVVVFIHGLGGNLQQFDEQIEKFAEYCDVVALDLPGSGKSLNWDKTSFTLTLDSFASFVQQFLIQKGFKDRKVILVGHSYGTQIVLKLLNRLDQGKVVGAVMIAPPKFLFKRNWLQNLVLKLLLNIPFVFQCFRKFDRVNNVHSVSLRRLFANVDEVSDYHKFKQFKFNLSTNSTNILTQALNWKPISSEEVIQAFQRLTTPLDSDSDETTGSLLIIDGDTDRVTHNGGSSYKDFLGNSNVEYSVVEKAGHNLMLERADELNELLSKFFAKRDARLKPGHMDEVRRRLIAL